MSPPYFLTPSEPMFEELHLTNFKNFRDATLELGPFTVLVGANASGKSNLRDAFRFLHGVGRGYDLAEILEEKFGEGDEKVWRGIRGGTSNVAFKEKERFGIRVGYDSRAIYQIEVALHEDKKESGGIQARLDEEKLLVSDETVFEIGSEGSARILRSPSGDYAVRRLDRKRPVLEHMANAHYDPGANLNYAFTHCMTLGTGLGSMRFFNLDPRALREPSKVGQSTLGDRGQNLASVLKGLCEDDEGRKTNLVRWVETLTPMDAKDFEFDVAKHSNEVTLVLVEKDGTQTPMQSASDGTLRFLGLLALLFQDDPPQLLFIEEIETGLHPTRLDLLANLIEQRTEQTDTQVIATTHSPQFLQVLDDETLADAQLVYRTGNGPEAKICPLLEVPTARKVLAKPRQNVRDLLSSGWFERVMAFSGGEAVGP